LAFSFTGKGVCRDNFKRLKERKKKKQRGGETGEKQGAPGCRKGGRGHQRTIPVLRAKEGGQQRAGTSGGREKKVNEKLQANGRLWRIRILGKKTDEKGGIEEGVRKGKFKTLAWKPHPDVQKASSKKKEEKGVCSSQPKKRGGKTNRTKKPRKEGKRKEAGLEVKSKRYSIVNAPEKSQGAGKKKKLVGPPRTLNPRKKKSEGNEYVHEKKGRKFGLNYCNKKRRSIGS